MLRNALRAIRLDAGLYETVRNDASFSVQAAAIVLITAIIAGTGGWLGEAEGSVRGLVQEVGNGVIGWLVWSTVTLIVGTRLFDRSSDFGQMARVLGFATSPPGAVHLRDHRHDHWWSVDDGCRIRRRTQGSRFWGHTCHGHDRSGYRPGRIRLSDPHCTLLGEWPDAAPGNRALGSALPTGTTGPNAAALPVPSPPKTRGYRVSRPGARVFVVDFASVWRFPAAS